MYLLDAGDETCFFAGDTALTPETHRVVSDIVHRNGRDLDVALLPIGHAPWWKPGFRRGHLSADDALQLFDRLEARYLVPYHWGTFEHVTSGAYDAINRLKSLLPTYVGQTDVRILEPGHSLEHIPATRDELSAHSTCRVRRTRLLRYRLRLGGARSQSSVFQGPAAFSIAAESSLDPGPLHHDKQHYAA